MKTDKYKDWESKFFEGEALSPEEELFLKSESDHPYFSTIKEEQRETLDVSFDDFMSTIVASDDVAASQIVPLPKPSFGSNFKNYWMAACLIAFMGLMGGYFFVNQNDGQIKHSDIVVKQDTEPDEIVVEPTVPVEKVEIVKPEVVKEVSEIKDQPQSQVVKVINNPSTIVNKDPESKILKPKVVVKEDGYQANYVIINGKPVYNEQEAISLTEDAVNYLASNVNKTVNHAKSVKNLNLDF